MPINCYTGRKNRVEIVSLTDKPSVGVAALVFKDGKLLLGKRNKSPGMNTWQCPGGLLEHGEAVFECARRETLEETGLVLHNLSYGPYTNNRFGAYQEHTVTLYVVAEYMGGELSNYEKDIADDWQWFNLNELPEPLFLPLQQLLEKHADWINNLGLSVV